MLSATAPAPLPHGLHPAETRGLIHFLWAYSSKGHTLAWITTARENGQRGTSGLGRIRQKPIGPKTRWRKL